MLNRLNFFLASHNFQIQSPIRGVIVSKHLQLSDPYLLNSGCQAKTMGHGV